MSVSEDQSEWVQLFPKNVWVANSIDQNTVNIDGENIVIGTAVFRVHSQNVRYIRLKIDQRHILDTPIGHMYYTVRDDGDLSVQTFERVKGPVPLIDRIWEEKDTRSAYQNALIQRRELFNGKRWAIGIRDISAYSIQYVETSTMISKKFDIPGGVDRVALEADVELPSSYTTDRAWIRFFVSPDDGASWHQISRIQDDYFGVPEVIAYNDNTPAELRIPGIGYQETLNTATSVRVKIEIDREPDDDTLTPTVKSYKLKVKQRSVG